MASGPLLLIVFGIGILFASALGLWAYNGSAVFFEMIRNGLAACFG